MKNAMYYIFILIAIVIILSEIYFRFFTDYNEPYFDKRSNIIKRKRNTEGRYITSYTNSGYFKINNAGWNSTRNYYEDKEEGKYRIAVIGHSNVEGLRNPVEKNFPNILEKELLKNDINAEVYTFGFSSMHMAQALHVSRYIIPRYHPDIVIIGTLSDDFFFQTTEDKYFLSLNIDNSDDIVEIAPTYSYRSYYNKSPLSSLYYLRLVKHFDDRFNIGKRIFNLILKVKAKCKKEEYIPYANIPNRHIQQLSNESYMKKVEKLREYIFTEFRNIEKNENIEFIFLGLPVNPASYNKFYDDYESRLEYVERTARQLKQYDLELLDLTLAFEQDYRINKMKFDFPGDGHLNEHAQKLIGNILAKYLLTKKIPEN